MFLLIWDGLKTYLHIIACIYLLNIHNAIFILTVYFLLYSRLINIEKLNKQNAQAVKTQPQNPEEFYNRVSSFRPGLWTVQELTPLECARWGWRVQEKDILQCITCREVVCAILPDIRDFKACEYTIFFVFYSFCFCLFVIWDFFWSEFLFSRTKNH